MMEKGETVREETALFYTIVDYCHLERKLNEQSD